MPENSVDTVADAAQGTLTNVHPRADGSRIPTPDDVMEGRGDFVTKDRDGNPEGLRIGHVENPDGWDVLVGDTPSTTTQQNAGALPISRPSYVQDSPQVNGPPAPSPNDPLLAKIPKPETPIVKALKAAIAGYPGTTPQSPLWYGYAWIKNGRLTELSSVVPFQLAQGQGVRVSWADPPDDADGVALFLPIPGISSATAPGPMYEQRRLYFARYKLSYYDLLGPYRSGGAARPAPTSNETKIADPSKAPTIHSASGGWTIGGDYHFYWTQTEENGNETLPSPAKAYFLGGYVTGRHISCIRPPLSAGATGWYLYMQKHETEEEGGKDAFGRLFWRAGARDHSAGEGKDFPISGSRHEEIPTSGDVSPGYGAYDVDVSSDALPTENKTGLDAPDAEPDTPIAFGASRPTGGQKYVRVVERVGSRRSVASNPASINLAFDEILRVVHREHTNLLANGDYIELDTNSIPLDHTVDTTGGFARVEDRKLVMGTYSAQAGTTPSDVFDPIPVDHTKEAAVWSYAEIRDPVSGTLAGSLEIVLREINASGTTTDTALFTHNAVGDYEDYRVINPTGGGGTAWRSDTVSAGFVVRFSGASKNLYARIDYVNFRDHKHKFRWDLDDQTAERRRPAGSNAQISKYLTVAPPPQTFSFPEPDRPKLAGTLREAVTFESGGFPAGWAQNITGGATLAVNAAAALVGSYGLRIQDTTTAALSSGTLSKIFDPAGGHEMGFHRKIRPATLPSGKLVLGGLARPIDGQLFAWFESGSIAEVQTLDIDSPPTDPGNFTVVPDGASAAVAVVATKQVEQLFISAAPTATSTITITLGSKKYLIPTGGSYESSQLTVQKPRYNGYLTVVVGGAAYNITVYATDSANAVARRIASTEIAGFSRTVKNNVVTFEARNPGPQTNASYFRGTSGTPGTMVTLQEGSAETAADLADRIAAMSFSPNWTVVHTPGSTTVTWTAVQAGAQTSATVSWGTSGASGAMSTTTPGAVDTPAALATRIRGTAFTGWTLSGTGAQVIFTANAAGFKRPLRINPAATGVKYHTATTQDGKNADLWAYVKDDTGTIFSWQLMAGLLGTTSYNAEVTIQGAGTESAVINFWGSIGAGTKTLLYRLENLSMVNYPAGMAVAGVSAEGVASETWEIHLDDIRVTDRGDQYFDETNVEGEKVGQFHHYGLPTQPVRQDIGLQDWYEPCVPGQQYAITAQLRYDNVPAGQPAKPVFITAHKDNGDVIEIGDVAGDAGISGTAPWYEPTPRLVIPPDSCYFLGFHSRDLSSGEIVVQRVVMSPGLTPKRTGAYATSGTYTATLEAATPYQPGVSADTPGIMTFWGHIRRVLEAFVDAPVGSFATVQYRAATTRAGLAGAAWQTDPLTLPDYQFVDVQIALTSGGTRDTIPVIISGSPRLVYDLSLTGVPLATLLRENRTELDGGAFFAEINEPSEPPEVAMNVLPGLKLQPQILSEQAPILPEGSAYLFTNEARLELVNNWYEPRVVETDGEALTVRLSAQPEFKRIPGVPTYHNPLDGKKYGVWVGKLAWGEIISRIPLV